MPKELTKRSKATYYRHRLEKAVLILKNVQSITENFEYWGVEQLFDFQDEINVVNDDINRLLEDIRDEGRKSGGRSL